MITATDPGDADEHVTCDLSLMSAGTLLGRLLMRYLITKEYQDISWHEIRFEKSSKGRPRAVSRLFNICEAGT